MGYTTMRHITLPCRSVLRVLLRRGRSGIGATGIPPTLGSYGTSISRSRTVSRSVRTCGVKYRATRLRYVAPCG